MMLKNSYMYTAVIKVYMNRKYSIIDSINIVYSIYVCVYMITYIRMVGYC